MLTKYEQHAQKLRYIYILKTNDMLLSQYTVTKSYICLICKLSTCTSQGRVNSLVLECVHINIVINKVERFLYIIVIFVAFIIFIYFIKYILVVSCLFKAFGF